WGSIGLAMIFALGGRDRLGATISPDRNPPYMLMSDGSVRNSYTLRLRNMVGRPRTIAVTIQGLPGGVFWTDSIGREDASRVQRIDVPADQTRTLRAYVLSSSTTVETKFQFVLEAAGESPERVTIDASFVVPGDDR